MKRFVPINSTADFCRRYFPLVLILFFFFRKQAVCIQMRSCVLACVPRWHRQPCSTATACQHRYDNRSPDDRKRHPSMSCWRAIPAQGFDASKDSIHRPNQKAVSVKQRKRGRVEDRESESEIEKVITDDRRVQCITD